MAHNYHPIFALKTDADIRHCNNTASTRISYKITLFHQNLLYFYWQEENCASRYNQCIYIHKNLYLWNFNLSIFQTIHFIHFHCFLNYKILLRNQQNLSLSFYNILYQSNI